MKKAQVGLFIVRSEISMKFFYLREKILNEKEYSELWNSIKDYNKPTKPDSVDFKNYIVIAYFAGDQTNGTEVKKVEKSGKEITVTYSRLSYDRNCHDARLLVTPYTIIRIIKQNDCSYKFDTEVKIVTCE